MINVGSNDLIAFGNGIFFNAFTKYPAIIPAISAPINPDYSAIYENVITVDYI